MRDAARGLCSTSRGRFHLYSGALQGRRKEMRSSRACIRSTSSLVSCPRALACKSSALIDRLHGETPTLMSVLLTVPRCYKKDVQRHWQLVTAPPALRCLLWCSLAISGRCDAAMVTGLGDGWGRKALIAAAAAVADGTLAVDTRTLAHALATWSSPRITLSLPRQKKPV